MSRIKTMVGALIVLSLATLVVAESYRATKTQTGANSPGAAVNSAEPELWWPLPAGMQKYSSIDGRHLHEYAEEITAISDKSRDEGNQEWGRIAGTSSSAQVQDWVKSKFHQIPGLQVSTQNIPLSPQWFANSWSLNASGRGKTIQMHSAYPALGSVGTPASGLDLDAVWVGLGTAADFAGKDVRGKIAVVYSWPAPGAFRNSNMEFGSINRAEDAGASAVVMILALPGNMEAATQFGIPRSPSDPVMLIGNDDGTALRQLIEQATPDSPARLHMQLNVKTVSGLMSSNEVGVLPGQTNELIFVMAHSDAYFEGASDNASGVATMVSLAEYYAKMPQAERRRTMYFIATPDHHGGGNGDTWLHANFQPEFRRTALILNCEHTSIMLPEWWTQKGPIGTELELVKTNGIHPEWWYVNGSNQMRSMFVKDLALFGVSSYLTPMTSSLGDIVQIHLDAPSADVINAETYYHTNLDTPENAPASGMQGVARAYAKFIDDVNTLSLKDALPPTPAQAPQGR